MKTSLQAFVVLGLLAVCFCEDTAKESSEKKVDRQDGDFVIIEMAAEDEGKPKRQTAEGRVVGGTQHFQYGASPGHYLLRTKEASPEPELAYLTLVKQFEAGQPIGQQQARPSQQQYVVQRQPQPEYAGQQQLLSREPKILQYQTDKRPVYQQQNQLILQQAYQSQRPIALRPSQPVKAAPVQAYYTNQAYADSAGHSLHEARVQAVLANEEKQAYTAPRHAIQYTNRPLQDTSFEKELAQLVAANQAVEYKAKAQQQSQHPSQHQPQPQQQQAQAAYYQQYQIPYKQEFLLQPVKKQEYTIMRQAAQGAIKYVAPTILARAKNPRPQQQQPLPQQYLIETTKPVAPQNKPIASKPRQQYIQRPTEEPKYFAYQTYPENVNAMKIVPAPQLQRIQPSPQPQYQYKQVAPKESQQQIPPEYLQYYQSIKAQTEEPASDSKQYYRLAQAKAQPSPPSYVAQAQAQPEYVDNYEHQTRLEESPKYATYSAPKAQQPQQSHQSHQSPQPQQYSAEDDQLIQSLLAQSQQKSRQGLSGFATDKAVSVEPKPKPQLTSASHSSIFVTKSLAPKKHSHSVTIEPSPSTEQEEEIATVRLPPPKNNKVYTQEEFQALVEAGYSVTPVPVRDDDDYQPSFSPAPVNYPGHSQYPAYPTGAPEPEAKKPTESYAPATAAPRKRKQRRPAAIRPQQQQYRYVQDTQAESESQDKATYASPNEEAVLNYGTRKQSRIRGSAARREITDSES